LSVYRVIKIPGILRLETITAPFTGEEMTLPLYEVRKALSAMGITSRISLDLISLKILSTAGPNSPKAMFGIWKDIAVWRDSPLLPVLRQYIVACEGESSEFLTLLNRDLDWMSGLTPAPSN